MDLWGRGHDAASVLGVARGRDAGTRDAGVMSMRSVQMMGQQQTKNKQNKKIRFELTDLNWEPTFYLTANVSVRCASSKADSHKP